MTEFGFIESIKQAFSGIPAQGFEGIGDDCAVLPLSDGTALVFTTDILVENVHFLLDAATPAELGHKALAVNLSDVAAMGARPVASMLSLALTDTTAGEWAGKFMEGYRSLSDRYSVPLVGGDTSRSKSGVAINVVAIGRVATGNIKRRSAARPGDIIMVAGELGASACGLNDILDGQYDTRNALIHKNPQPQIEEGIWLGSRSEVNAMMDLSDGLASDLMHILKASGAGARIETSDIPAAADIASAVCGGEDYKLLFTVREEAAQRIAGEFAATFGYSPSAVGRIVAAEHPAIVWLENGVEITPDWHGFSHF